MSPWRAEGWWWYKLGHGERRRRHLPPRARMTALRRNLELKARCADLPRAAEAARKLAAADAGELRQLDTYFIVPNGRLKLRETEGLAAELIWYARVDSASVRRSDYHVLPIPKAAETRDALSRALGVRGAVRKHRRLWLWENVRIHLDDVEGLGTFVEFEAVIDASEGETQSMRRVATLCEALGINDADRVPVSY